MILQTLASYDYTVTTTTYTVNDTGLSGGMLAFAILLGIAVAVFMIAAMWRVLTKAGRPGWAAIVPIYGNLQLIWAAGKPWWWFILMVIPFVNIIAMFVIYYNLAKAFGKGVGYTLLLVFLPFIGFPVLAWGNATYKLKKPKNGM